MANPFVKAWRYLMALFSSKVDEYADPKVQIQQAIEEAQRQHQALTQQAAQVIGNQRQLEMRLNRQLADIEKLQVNVRQALTLADQATAAGDAAKATEYNNAAEAFAAQLVTGEQSVEDLKGLHDQALQAAGQAKKAVEQNAMMLQQKIAERTKLLSQLEQAKMQEQVSASLRSMTEIAAPGNTPSLDEVRQKIERRYANAMGSAELAQNSVQGRMLEVQQASVQMAGHSRLEQIRASMRGEALPSGGSRHGHPGHPGVDAGGDTRKAASVSSQCPGVAVKSRSTASRPEAWRSLLQRGVDTAAELSDVLAQKLSSAADPRAKQLRKRKWALRLGLFFTLSCVFWVAVTAVLASWSTPVWALFIPAPIAVGAAFLATLSFLRYRWLPRRTAASAAVPGHPAATAVGFGGPPTDGRAGRFRARAVLVDQRDGAGPDAACGRASRADRGREPVRRNHGGNRRRSGVDGAGDRQRSSVARSPGTDHQRVHRPAGPRRPPVQRDGHRGSAIGVRRE